jgi:hypothetical protein
MKVVKGQKKNFFVYIFEPVTYFVVRHDVVPVIVSSNQFDWL